MVLLFVQNVILKYEIYHNKHFVIYCFFRNMLGIEKARKNATR
jgi:hypothetical protein